LENRKDFIYTSTEEGKVRKVQPIEKITVFQEFILNWDLLDESKINPQAGTKLIEELKDLGYEILLMQSFAFSNAPVKFIAGSEGRNPKLDIGTISKKLGLVYKSGDCYFKKN